MFQGRCSNAFSNLTLGTSGTSGTRWNLLFGCEAVKEPCASGCDQVLLAAAFARMGRVPRAVAAALLVAVSDLRAAGAVARPVIAGMVGAVGIRAAVGGRTREDVVLVRLVADAVDEFAFFRQRELLADRVADARLLDGVAMQHALVGRDDLAPEVVPRPVANPVARAHGAGALRAEVGAPHGVTLSSSLGERLAVRVGAGEPAEIRAVALAHTGDKERQGLFLRGLGRCGLG